MDYLVEMPALGDSVTEGTVTRWLKQVGEWVELDEPLLEVSTDKVDTEIPSPIAGTLLEITAGEDETVAVGGQLAVIRDGIQPTLAHTVSSPPSTPYPTTLEAPLAGWFGERQTPRLLRYWDGTRWATHTWLRPETIFVSYSRADEVAVCDIVEDLHAFRVPVWRDTLVESGDLWWDEILHHIREAAVFLHVVSDASLSSEACKSERQYAELLGIPILPVQVGPISNIRSRHELLRQVIDYRSRDVRRAVRLMAGIRNGQQRRFELPDPLPESPETPFPWLQRIHNSLSVPEISWPDQSRIFSELRRHLSDQDDNSVRAEIYDLLRLLKDRPDSTRATVDDVEWLLLRSEKERKGC